MEAKQFLCPPQIFYGEDALELAGEKLADLGKKALIVTDKMMVQLGYIENLTKVLDTNGVAYAIYDGANAETQDVSGHVRAEIDRLPPQFRAILTLYHLDQMSYNEIGEIMKMPAGTV